MNLIRCPKCSKDFTSAGIKGHLRFKEGLTTTEINNLNLIPMPNTSAGFSPVNSFPAEANISRSVQISQESLDLKRMQLEDKRLDLELDKLNKGTTTSDPWDKMLQITQENNKQQLAMLEKLNDAKLDNLRLELGAGGEDDLVSTVIKSLAPSLPLLLKAKEQPTTNAPPISSVVNTQTKKEINQMDLSSIPQEYKDAVKSGKLTENDAWKQFKLGLKLGKVPKEYKKVTREQFHIEFEKVKNGV